MLLVVLLATLTQLYMMLRCISQENYRTFSSFFLFMLGTGVFRLFSLLRLTILTKIFTKLRTDDGAVQPLDPDRLRSGGIGRRAGFRCLCPSGRGGSTPFIRIKLVSWAFHAIAPPRQEKQGPTPNPTGIGPEIIQHLMSFPLRGLLPNQDFSFRVT